MEILEPADPRKVGIVRLGTAALPSTREKARWECLREKGRRDSPNTRAELKGLLTRKVRIWKYHLYITQRMSQSAPVRSYVHIASSFPPINCIRT